MLLAARRGIDHPCRACSQCACSQFALACSCDDCGVIPVVQGCVLVIAVIYVLVNVALDVAYAVADPRVRVQAASA